MMCSSLCDVTAVKTWYTWWYSSSIFSNSAALSAAELLANPVHANSGQILNKEQLGDLKKWQYTDRLLLLHAIFQQCNSQKPPTAAGNYN